jgi:hypothetical protein
MATICCLNAFAIVAHSIHNINYTPVEEWKSLKAVLGSKHVNVVNSQLYSPENLLSFPESSIVDVKNLLS